MKWLPMWWPGNYQSACLRQSCGPWEATFYTFRYGFGVFVPLEHIYTHTHEEIGLFVGEENSCVQICMFSWAFFMGTYITGKTCTGVCTRPSVASSCVNRHVSQALDPEPQYVITWKNANILAGSSRARAEKYIHTHMHTYIHTYIHTYMYIYI